MKLRDYQDNCKRAVFGEWEGGVRKTLVVQPTGCGKTVTFASIIHDKLPAKAMVIAHRSELIWQARDKIQRMTGVSVDVEMGEHKASLEGSLFHPKSQVIVSTIQTHTSGGDGGGRMGKFDPEDFGLLIIDEAHHAISPSYRRVIDYYTSNPELVVLGVTATPNRADEEALGQVFETVAFDYEIIDAIHDGWLVPIDQQLVSVESLDLSHVRTTAGDLNGVDLAAVMEAEKNLHEIASSSIDIVGEKRGIGFAASVDHARMLSNIFNRHRPGMSAFVHGGTPRDERVQIVERFTRGDIQWLWNYGVFTEGFDADVVDVVVMARLTKSQSLYAQMAGRATRPCRAIANRLGLFSEPVLRRTMIARSSKPSCLIVDFVGNSGRHKLVGAADILGGNVSEEVIESVKNSAKKSGGPVRIDRELEDEEKRQEEARKRKLEEEARKARLVGKSSYKLQRVDPFDLFEIKPVSARGWHKGKLLSEKMRNVLRNAGFNPDELDYARGRQLCSIIIERYQSDKCTLKQASLLKRHGWSSKEVEAMHFKEASKAIDSLAKNGWRRPTQSQSPATPTPDSGDDGDDNIPF